MSKYSKQEYILMFDSLLSEELYFSSTFASEANILSAIKRVLGRSIKNDCILGYSDLFIDTELNVHFKITDPDKEVLSIALYYGA